ncbi:hypothetical protein ATO3_25650 [Marinibacterium profundimaris]|uniref:Uncharacterized protein n=1 Tax=Marinibacterium profundimaris TaxID=1679460 RepID=A0A225NFQ8_9RHOB|nr:hypothetical protein ATO3_25650 [Marinibacterium profundimaris]
MFTVTAQGKAAQREVFVDVRPCGDTRPFTDTVLHTGVGIERDQPVMLAFAKRDAPGRHFDISGIVRTAQQADDLLIAHEAVREAGGECRFGFQIGLHLGLRGKAPAGKAFKGFGNDRGERFVPDQQLAMSGHTFIAKARRCGETPVTVHGTGAHAVGGLFAVLLALVL